MLFTRYTFTEVHRELTGQIDHSRRQVFLARGHEYIPVINRLEIVPDTTLTREYVLTRQIDLPAQNWYGGDMHTHFSRWEPKDNYIWSYLLQAEDLHAVNNMVYKAAGVVEAPQYAYGAEGEHHIHEMTTSTDT